MAMQGHHTVQSKVVRTCYFQFSRVLSTTSSALQPIFLYTLLQRAQVPIDPLPASFNCKPNFTEFSRSVQTNKNGSHRTSYAQITRLITISYRFITVLGRNFPKVATLNLTIRTTLAASAPDQHLQDLQYVRGTRLGFRLRRPSLGCPLGWPLQ